MNISDKKTIAESLHTSFLILFEESKKHKKSGNDRLHKLYEQKTNEILDLMSFIFRMTESEQNNSKDDYLVFKEIEKYLC